MKQFDKEPATLTISRAAELLGISRGKIKRLIDSGRFRGHKIGHRIYLLTEEVIEDLKK